MATLFDYPNLTGSGISGIMTYGNTATDGFLGMFLIFIAFCGITLVSIQISNEFDKSVAVGSWGAGLSAIVLFGMGAIGESILIVCGICTAVSTIFVLSKR